MKINFFSEDIAFTLKKKKIIRDWINSVISSENKKLGNINFIFCSDSYLHNINTTYLNHDSLTDIITFQYNDPDDSTLSGDIFISIDRVGENANQFKLSISDELNRVIIHGILHLCGYKDKTKAAQKQMRTLEDKSLSLLKNLL
ncbi:MAG: rRNA maturation RNase YbeY [Bacteroidales bacterium]|nr:rRNA maturation RNase YbeY [Bacteroidales bacterium]